MSFQQQQVELRTRFNTVWNNRTVVDWPNMPVSLPTPMTPWVRFRVSGGEGRQTTIGSTPNNQRYAGLIFFQVFVPIDTGDSLAFQYADQIVAIFQNWCGTNITCNTATVNEVGVGDGYYQVNVVVPFTRNELL